MILFKKAADLTQYLFQESKEGKTIGFVPTMGALHQGHLSLIQTAKKQTSLTVCSIFVNPTQFNNADDFKHYPITIEKDIEALIASQCDVLFLPSVSEIYPVGYTAPHYDLGYLETVLEGHYRPGHFQGVCQVVDRLLQIVSPQKLYVGQKDFQQCKVLERLIELTHQTFAIDLVTAPTLREKDGLAMSSRNLRLTAAERQLAPAIYQELVKAQTAIKNKPIEQIEATAVMNLERAGFKVEYFKIVDRNTLQQSAADKDLIALVAAYLGQVRLIDNLLLN